MAAPFLTPEQQKIENTTNGGAPYSQSYLDSYGNPQLSNPNNYDPNIAQNTTPQDTGGAPGVDPYAQWGGVDNYNRLASGFTTQDQTIHGSANDSAESAALARHSSILDFLDQTGSSQRGIDERGVQNELGKKQGYNSIVDAVGRGLKSGGTLLANKNALSSSAAQAIAMAYGDFGRREMSKVGNQYELENRGIGLAQSDLEHSKATGLRKFGESEQQGVLQIVSDARNKLAALDAAEASASMPERVNIESERAAIQGQVQGILGKFDTELNQGASAIAPTSGDSRRATAFGLANAGVAATNPFDFNTNIPTEFQNTGPFSNDLPIFSTLKGKKQAA